MRPLPALAAGAATALAFAATALGGAFPVNPGAVVEGRPIVGSGQNLPPIVGTTWNQGASAFPQVSWYYESDALPRDQSQVVAAARSWVQRRVRATCAGSSPANLRRCRVAVVFDLDDTLMSTWPYEKAQDPPLSFNTATWNAFVQACGYEPIRPSIDLLNDLRRQGVYVAIISGGSVANSPYSRSCLRRNGVKGWDQATFRPTSAAALTAAQFKGRVRMALENKGYRIIASIGDQVSDMSWGHLERGFLMPNVMAHLA
ncbi:MAG: HAD family acid phosphatase [Miltoncostaeaceae bacterium]